jgi:hypothetical protein
MLAKQSNDNIKKLEWKRLSNGTPDGMRAV